VDTVDRVREAIAVGREGLQGIFDLLWTRSGILLASGFVQHGGIEHGIVVYEHLPERGAEHVDRLPRPSDVIEGRQTIRSGLPSQILDPVIIRNGDDGCAVPARKRTKGGAAVRRRQPGDVEPGQSSSFAVRFTLSMRCDGSTS